MGRDENSYGRSVTFCEHSHNEIRSVNKWSSNIENKKISDKNFVSPKFIRKKNIKSIVEL